MLFDAISPISLAATAILIFLSVVYYFIKNRDILPGPSGVPYLGLLPILTNENCHLQLQKIGEKYGDLFSFTFSGKLIINLGSAKAMREVHVNRSECFAGRYTDFNLLTATLPDGVGMSNGEAWKVLRKYVIQSTKQYGLTVITDNTVDPVYNSVSQTLEDLLERKGKPFNVIELLTQKCMATMKTVVFGEHGISDEDLLEINHHFASLVEGISGVRSLLFGPVGRLMFKTLPELRGVLDHNRLMSKVLIKSINNIKSSMDEDHPFCVVEDFYRERNARRKLNDPSWEYFSDKALLSTLGQIVGDGILSVAYFIGCFLNALVEHPEEQEKIYKELMEVVGANRLPTVEDKNKLTYTNAFINEVIRTSNFFTLFPSMECTKETTVRGYRIPKGSITLLNIWQAHHDPDAYKNPDKFDPSRFVASPGKPRAELPVQFGVGKRACTGEGFVMTQAFLYLTSIVKKFTISEPPNSTTKHNLFLMTGNMELCLEPRCDN